MLQTHILLALLWILYGVFHSALASSRFKNRVFQSWPGLRPRYRLLYIIFAAASLAALLLFQLRLASPLLLGPAWRAPGAVVAILGASLMAVCIAKYFRNLSGLRSLAAGCAVANELRVDGIHRYVRHPLYLSTFLAIWGLFAIFPYASLLVMNVVIQGYTMIALRFEEEKLIHEFGAAYERYRLAVPRLWPAFTRK